MTVRAQSALLAFVLLLASAGTAVAAQDAVVREITTRLDAAVNASSVEQARKLMREAEALFQGPRVENMGKLPRQFLRAEVERTHGRIAAMLWQRLGPDSPRRAIYRDEARRWLSKATSGLRVLVTEAERARLAHEQRLGKQHTAYRRDSQWREAKYYERLARHNAAWAEYTAARLADPATRSSHLHNATELFEQFGEHLFDPFNANAVFGKGLCLLDLGKHRELTTYLEDTLADHQELEKALGKRERGTAYKRLIHLLLKAYDACAERDKLEECAKEYLAQLPQGQREVALDRDIRLLRKRNLVAMGRADPGSKIDQNRAKYDARPALEAAGRSFDAKQYRKAAATAEHGLLILARRPAVLVTQPRHGDDTHSIQSDLRYVRAAAYWNLGRWLDAHNGAYEFLRHHAKDLRVRDREVGGQTEPGMCRIAFEAALRARKTKPGLGMAEYVQFLDFIEMRLPEQEEAQKAPYYRGQAALDAGEYTKAIRVFREIPATSPLYRRARYALGLAAYRLVEAEPRWLKLAIQDVTQCLTALDGDVSTWPDTDRPLARSGAKLAIAMTHRLIALEPASHREAVALLDHAKELRAVGGDLGHELLALRVAADALAGRTAAAMRLLGAVGNETTTGVLARSFAGVGSHLERAYNRLSEAGRRTEAREMASILMGVYAIALRPSRRQPDEGMQKLQLYCRLQLAKNLQRLGRHREAIPHYEWLLGRDQPETERAGRVPRSSSGGLLRGLALAYEGVAADSGSNHERVKSYGVAIDTWRELAKGTRVGTNEWLEARYHLIQVLLLSGQPKQARDLLQYLRVQCPQSRAGDWGKRLQELERRLDVSDQ